MTRLTFKNSCSGADDDGIDYCVGAYDDFEDAFDSDDVCDLHALRGGGAGGCTTVSGWSLGSRWPSRR